MNCYVGIDLGSTTSKAVLLDDEGQILGKGLTNSRSNYALASQIALTEAKVTARFSLFKRRLEADPSLTEWMVHLLPLLEKEFRYGQYSCQLDRFSELASQQASKELAQPLSEILQQMQKLGRQEFEREQRKSDFFRDLAASHFSRLAEEISTSSRTVSYEALMRIFDSSILEVENQPLDLSFESHIAPALKRTLAHLEAKPIGSRCQEILAEVLEEPLSEQAMVGTGYGRQTLPFPKERIRSEILCHGLGAHITFPATRTVLDIGGQDTKAIQVDEHGIVTNFQMNDRCAAGCGRYLGYIAEEMNLGLHELAPLAARSQAPVKINSTCTVFAGLEIRERLALGEKREDILAGLHRAIILRALSLLARSGGVKNEFTFTGGVAKNEEAVRVLKTLVKENYGPDIKINISPDSIYTGALGAAHFALREHTGAVTGKTAATVSQSTGR